MPRLSSVRRLAIAWLRRARLRHCANFSPVPSMNRRWSCLALMDTSAASSSNVASEKDASNADDWAQALGTKSRSIRRAFTVHSDFTFAEWRNGLRMQRAMSWLYADQQANWVSHHLGFAHVSAFSRAFRRYTGSTVGDHQAEVRVTVRLLR